MTEPTQESPSHPDTLLIVDDDPLMTDLFRLHMTKRGFHVLTAASGREALETVAQDATIRLVITDMTMPDMDGRAVAQALSAQKPDLPVLIATGHNTDLPDLPANVQGVIQKPYQNRELAERIRTLLENRQEK